jgi:hypothetical protein
VCQQRFVEKEIRHVTSCKLLCAFNIYSQVELKLMPFQQDHLSNNPNAPDILLDDETQCQLSTSTVINNPAGILPASHYDLSNSADMHVLKEYSYIKAEVIQQDWRTNEALEENTVAKVTI